MEMEAEVAAPPASGEGGTEALAPDPEVLERPRRRTFTAAYKLRILEEADRAGNGEVGALLRREGLYSSHLTDWRKARESGVLEGLGRRRGPKKGGKAAAAASKRVQQLEREVKRLREKLRKAEVIIDVQGKVAGLLGLNLEREKNS